MFCVAQLLYLIALYCTGVAFTMSTHCFLSCTVVVLHRSISCRSRRNLEAEVKVTMVVVFDCRGRAGDLFGLCTAQVFVLPRSSPRVSITINQPLALLHTYRIPETLFTTISIHNAPVVCFHAVWEPKHSGIGV